MYFQLLLVIVKNMDVNMLKIIRDFMRSMNILNVSILCVQLTSYLTVLFISTGLNV